MSIPSTISPTQTEEQNVRRQNIVAKLNEKLWFRESREEIKSKLLGLSYKWDPFLSDLTKRKDVVGGLVQKEIVDFYHDAGQFGCIITFKVENESKQQFSYMYFSWRRGSCPGAKGQIFVVDDDNKITGFLRMKSEKFALGGSVLEDLAGGFREEGETIEEAAAREIREEIGEVEITDLKVLGDVYPDAGMANAAPSFFYATVRFPKELVSAPNTDTYEAKAEFEILPIEKYKEFISGCADGLSVIIYGKLIAKGIISQ